MVIRSFPIRSYAASDPACQNECGNILNPFEWGCYLEKMGRGCGGSTGMADITGSGQEDTGQMKQDICNKSCYAPGENTLGCYWAKTQANCGGSIFGNPLLLLGGGLFVVLILVILLRRK